TARSALAAAGSATPPAPRLAFDDATFTVTLDGTPYAIGDPKTYRLYKANARARQPPETDAPLRKQVPGLNGRHAVPRRLKDLPGAVRATVHTSTAGHWLQLPPGK